MSQESGAIPTPKLLWSCVTRNDTILVEAGEEFYNDQAVSRTAQLLLNKKPTPGFEFVNNRKGIHLKGIKFHIYDNIESQQVIWIFAVVYDPLVVDQRSAQSFLEKIVGISQNFRENDNAWKYGGTLCCQSTFAPILLQRMQEVTYLGKMAMLEEQLDSSRQLMQDNISRIMERGENIDQMEQKGSALNAMASVFKKQSKQVRRRMMMQNAKHGLLLGTAITVAVGIVVVPPLVAIL